MFRALAMVRPEDVEVAKVATNIEHRVVTVTYHQASKASAVTTAHHIPQGNVLHMYHGLSLSEMHSGGEWLVT